MSPTKADTKTILTPTVLSVNESKPLMADSLLSRGWRRMERQRQWRPNMCGQIVSFILIGQCIESVAHKIILWVTTRNEDRWSD